MTITCITYQISYIKLQYVRENFKQNAWTPKIYIQKFVETFYNKFILTFLDRLGQRYNACYFQPSKFRSTMKSKIVDNSLSSDGKLELIHTMTQSWVSPSTVTVWYTPDELEEDLESSELSVSVEVGESISIAWNMLLINRLWK